MEIVFTEDVSVKKGWVEGTVVDWPRPVITSMEGQVGHRFYDLHAPLASRLDRQKARKQPKKPAKKKSASKTPLEAVAQEG